VAYDLTIAIALAGLVMAGCGEDEPPPTPPEILNLECSRVGLTDDYICVFRFLDPNGDVDRFVFDRVVDADRREWEFPDVQLDVLGEMFAMVEVEVVIDPPAFFTVDFFVHLVDLESLESEVVNAGTLTGDVPLPPLGD
jgi:hypothetical protein